MLLIDLFDFKSSGRICKFLLCLGQSPRVSLHLTLSACLQVYFNIVFCTSFSQPLQTGIVPMPHASMLIANGNQMLPPQSKVLYQHQNMSQGGARLPLVFHQDACHGRPPTLRSAPPSPTSNLAGKSAPPIRRVSQIVPPLGRYCPPVVPPAREEVHGYNQRMGDAAESGACAPPHYAVPAQALANHQVLMSHQVYEDPLEYFRAGAMPFPTVFLSFRDGACFGFSGQALLSSPYSWLLCFTNSTFDFLPFWMRLNRHILFHL